MLRNVIRVDYNLNNNRVKYQAQTRRPIVYVLENFHRSFANLVASLTDGTAKCSACCRVHLVL